MPIFGFGCFSRERVKNTFEIRFLPEEKSY